MQKVKLIHHGWLSAPNGANTVMNSLLECKEQFQMSGIEMTSLTIDSFSPRSFDNVSQRSTKAVLRSRMKKWLKNATRYSRLACDIMIYITELLPGKKIVQKYFDSQPNKSEVAFFHTIAPCYYFLKKNKQQQHTVVVLHTNGESYKMDKIYYPKLVHSLVYKEMLKMEEYVLKNVDRINFVSEFSMNNFLRLHPDIDKKKISFIYNGVKDEINARRNRKNNDVLEFCCVASISKRKGQHYIIDAMKKFTKDKLPMVHFTFVGGGADLAFLEKEVKDFGLEKYITFAGISQNVDDYLVNSDIFILPSEDEGLPMAIIEAMRASLPIVSTPVGGIPEMVDNGQNGLLMEPSVEGVYELLCNVNSYNWKLMGKNARKSFEEKFTVEKMVDGYISLLRF